MNANWFYYWFGRWFNAVGAVAPANALIGVGGELLTGVSGEQLIAG